jgi:type I restriction enzyme S subunit
MKNWEVKKLGDVCSFFNGQAHEKCIDENGKYKLINSKFVSSEGENFKRTNNALSPLFVNDIVMVMSDVPNGKTLAKCFIVDNDDTYTLNQRICVIRSKNFDTRFLYYQLNRNKYLLSFDNGENQSNLRKDDILNYELFVPPLAEQKRIVAILDEAFAALSKAKANAEQNLKNAKELFDSYIEGLFLNLFQTKETKTISELAKVIGGFSFKSGDFKKEGKYQVIRMGNVRHGVIRENESPIFIDTIDDKVLTKALLLPNDVIITQTGTKNKRDYGFTVIIEKKNYLLNQRIASIRFSDKYLPKFFLYYSWTNVFRDQYFENETGTVGQGNVGISAITDAEVPFIPVMEQKLIVDKIDGLITETQKLEAIYQTKINDLEELKKSVLQKAFSGELKTAKALV